jgi:Uncharacterized protein conserved in archaea
MTSSSDWWKAVESFLHSVEKGVQEGSQQLAEGLGYGLGKLSTILDELGAQVSEVGKQSSQVLHEKFQESAEYVRSHSAAAAEEAKQHLTLDELAHKIALIGLPALAFVVACSIASSAGLAGGAVVVAALAMLGGPVGLVGGLLTLGLLTLIADAVSKYGLNSVLLESFKARRERGISMEQIHSEIDSLWISDELKYKLKTQLATPQNS